MLYDMKLKESYDNIDDFVNDVEYKILKFAEENNWLLVNTFQDSKSVEYYSHNKAVRCKKCRVFITNSGNKVVLKIYDNMNAEIGGSFIQFENKKSGYKKDYRDDIKETISKIEQEMSKARS
jgi:hypothetical protein